MGCPLSIGASEMVGQNLGAFGGQEVENAYLLLNPTEKSRATRWRGGDREKDEPSLVNIPGIPQIQLPKSPAM